MRKAVKSVACSPPAQFELPLSPLLEPGPGAVGAVGSPSSTDNILPRLVHRRVHFNFVAVAAESWFGLVVTT
ncbi:unnamed protein product [Protopolystoma xenopodis]|uniref:Uncharacterized protein n=1 Tax=Protopolystoma xenopodis TaxID=117903 RepID=A0A3S5BE81_9PLAT|nr:unnamed protein product [Protopolystoma xenopodis]